MKTILFVHQSAEMYGSDKVLLFVVNGIVSSGKYAVLVVLPSYGPLFEALRQAGADVRVGEVAKIQRAVFTPEGLLALIRRCFQAVKEYDELTEGRDLLCVHSNTLAVMAGAVWAKKRSIKHLWHVHEIILSPKLVSFVFPKVVSFFSDFVVSNSRATRKWLLKNAAGVLNKEAVVFNGLPTPPERRDADVISFRKRLAISERAVLFTLAGRINKWKGQGLLVEAVALLQKTGRLLPESHFLFVGDAAPGLDSIVTDLKERISGYGLQGRFSFVSFVEDIWPVWYSTDVGLVPSTEPEPFGMVAIEAMAAGLPVVAARHGGLLDIVEHEKTGLFFFPGDPESLAECLDRLQQSPELRRKLGKAGVSRQKSLFSIDAQVEGLLDVYRRFEV